MQPQLRFEFVTSAAKLSQLPDSAAEVAVVGRSNVGKSSLLNALNGRTAVAHVSKTPGRTQLLNCFSVSSTNQTKKTRKTSSTPDGKQHDVFPATVMDLPGYGYAKVPSRVQAEWQEMIETYLLERDNLVMVMVLVDGLVGPTALDVAMLEWLRSEQLPHTVIATKHDKVKSSQRQKRKRELAEKCDLEIRDVVWVSAAKRTNLDTVAQLMKMWLNLEPSQAQL